MHLWVLEEKMMRINFRVRIRDQHSGRKRAFKVPNTKTESSKGCKGLLMTK